MMRRLSLIDNLLSCADNALRTLAGGYQTTARQNPAAEFAESELSNEEVLQVSRLMRINHCGEVCAQALYQGQSLTAQLDDVKEKMQQAAKEENDHLKWCQHRLTELNAKPSLFNPIWYTHSFAIGALAGLAGDKWSLGFVVETENQVVEHLEKHLTQIPAKDKKTIAILSTMKEDELHHATLALESGGKHLPSPIKFIMSLTSKVMTKTTYYI